MKKELVSIIIPCFNQVEFTKKCVESIIKNTSYPYELLLIDNGSTDSTGDYLRSLDNDKIKTMLPGNNLGVSGALNLGINSSSGEYVCYLNNDTFLPSMWLSRLIACAESDNKIGIVGACTNTGNLLLKDDEMNRAAQIVALVRSGDYKDIEYVHGFCMLIKRSLIKKIGEFDEQFYPCGGEDIDYSYRALREGYNLKAAMDVFIYHYGHQSTRDPGFNKQYGNIDDVTLEAQKIFIKKWGSQGLEYVKKINWASSNIDLLQESIDLG